MRSEKISLNQIRFRFTSISTEKGPASVVGGLYSVILPVPASSLISLLDSVAPAHRFPVASMESPRKSDFSAGTSYGLICPVSGFRLTMTLPTSAAYQIVFPVAAKPKGDDPLGSGYSFTFRVLGSS